MFTLLIIVSVMIHNYAQTHIMTFSFLIWYKTRAIEVLAKFSSCVVILLD